jgi:ATP citrate (pro-S)-lyase
MKHDTSFLSTIRTTETAILVIGFHAGIIQSILDFDAMVGKAKPSIVAIITGNRKSAKFFFGTHEIRIPCYAKFAQVPETLRTKTQFLLNLQSGRRAYETTVEFFENVPHALGAHIFAENVPEQHAHALHEKYGDKWIVGPSGVGLLVTGHIKLGAIGGITPDQMKRSELFTRGNVAVISTSGGMVGELIRSVAQAGKRTSFSACVGGDRFPVSSYTDFFLLAESDPETKGILYYGELGGSDEYEIAKLIKEKRLTKPCVAYIAGTVDESFPERTQFGHARALAQNQSESARAKRTALRDVGVVTPDSFVEFLDAIKKLPDSPFTDPEMDTTKYEGRRASILSTRKFFHEDTLHVSTDEHTDLMGHILRVLLPKTPTSPILSQFLTTVFTSLIDHGGHVSGAVNTMITARAGKDLVSSLTAGLLTIGPRFGGAINEAARTWRRGVAHTTTPKEFVDEENRKGILIPGIGHKKYRIGMPDPRVALLAQYAEKLSSHPHYDFARSVEAITTAKSGSLILNVDGIVAALTLDILSVTEGYSDEELDELVGCEFFNALFVIPRSIGFIGHFLEQKRNDEGLFRLPDNLLFEDE